MSFEGLKKTRDDAKIAMLGTFVINHSVYLAKGEFDVPDRFNDPLPEEETDNFYK